MQFASIINENPTDTFRNKFVQALRKMDENHPSSPEAIDRYLSMIKEKIPHYYHKCVETIAIAVYLLKFDSKDNEYSNVGYKFTKLQSVENDQYPNYGYYKRFDRGIAISLVDKLFSDYKTDKKIRRVLVDVTRYYECLVKKS